jgi:hypothetical protein
VVLKLLRNADLNISRIRGRVASDG